MVMPTLLPSGRMRMQHDADPKAMLMDKLGALPPRLVMFNHVLVAIYEPGETATKTKGGIIIPDKTKSEYIWQGAAGLVVAMGPKAYKDDETTKFDGEKIEVGEWVWFRASDGTVTQVNGVTCRIFRRETDIIGVIPDPDYVF